MWFYILMFLCNLLVPLTMWTAGQSMYKHPPKNRNGYTGYRSKLAKMNQDTWLFAHDYCGRLWKKLGFILLIPSILVQLPFMYSTDTMIGIMTAVLISVQTLVMLASIVCVEKALKRTFDSSGIRK